MALDTKDLKMSNITRHIEVIGGILYGISGSEHLDELTACVDGGKGFVDEVEEAFAEITTPGFHNKLDGFKKLSEAIQEMPEVLSACDNMGPDITKLIDTLSVFRHPVLLKNTITYNVGKHKLALGLDVAEAKKDNMKAKYFKYGEDIAAILEVVTQPIPSFIESFDRSNMRYRSTFCNDTFNSSTVIDPYNLTTCDYNEIVFGVLYGVIDE